MGYLNPFNVLYDLIGLVVFNTPLTELLEDNSVGKSLSADSDALQHTIASQLLQNQVSVQLSCLRGGKTIGIFYTRDTRVNKCYML